MTQTKSTEAAPPKTITIAGREFKTVTNASAEHDVFFTAAVGRSGIGERTLREGDDLAAFARRMYLDIVSSGELWSILGASIMPSDRDVSEWTPQVAEETAAFCKELTDPADKRVIFGQVNSFVAGFLLAELTLRETLPNSLRKTKEGQALVSPAENLSDAPAGPSAPGQPSSESSQPTTL